MNARGFAIAACFTLAGGAAVASTPVVDRVDGLMRDLVSRNLFQGAVVVGTGGRIDYAAGFGFAEFARRVPFTPDTRTDGASMAKTFTAAALLQLAAEQRDDLDAPVRGILPECLHPTTRVRHLLVHSAGLPNYEWFDSRVPKGEVRTNGRDLALVTRGAPRPNSTAGPRLCVRQCGL